MLLMQEYFVNSIYNIPQIIRNIKGFKETLTLEK